MQRLAWFSPLPPERSPVARYSAELLPALARDRVIDVYAPAPANDDQPGAAAVLDPADFAGRQRAAPYDLVVYQLAAAPAHDSAWPCLLRHPGLVVLHDDNFHAARARMLLADGRGDAYRAELAHSHPDVPADAGSLGASGLLGATSRLWPMRRTALEAARGVLLHNAWLAARIGEEAPGVPAFVVDPGVPDIAQAAADRSLARRRYGIPQDAVVFAAADDLRPAARLPRMLRALAGLPEGGPAWRLLVCGERADCDQLQVEAQALGVGQHLAVAGDLTADELPAFVTAADVGVSLRWPPCRTASAAWLRWLAAAKPTIMTDLVHVSDVPALDPRDWRVAGQSGARDAAGRAVEPVAVAIDILDEDHSLGLAAARLAADAALRAELGNAARRLWQARFSLDRMAAGYAQAIDGVCGMAAPAGTR